MRLKGQRSMVAFLSLAACMCDDDGDFDDESLIRWRRHKMRAQGGARGTRLSTGSTRMAKAGRGRDKRGRGMASVSPHTTYHLTHGQSSDQHVVTTPLTACTVVELEPSSVCHSMCSREGEKWERQVPTESIQQDVRCGDAMDVSECAKSGETEASYGRTVVPENDCLSWSEMETHLADKAENMELLSGAFESPKEDYSLAVDGACNITSSTIDSCIMSSTHSQELCSNSRCATGQLAGSLHQKSLTSNPHSCFDSTFDYSPKKRRRDSAPLARGRWKKTLAGRRASSMAQYSSGQTSLLQFATTVHKSVSDSLQARRQSRTTGSGQSHASVVSDPQCERKNQCSAVTGKQVVAVSGATISCQDLCLPSQEFGPTVHITEPAPYVSKRVSEGRTESTVGMPMVGTSSDGGVGRGRDRVSRGGKRQCPFYKRVPETGMVVDAFSYGSIPDCPAYFLSHFHSDHYMGLSRRFQHPIYCSQVTANLVHHVLKVPHSVLHPLPLHTLCLVEGVEVILIDANHCPGSVMFLFRAPSGKNYLHTGDFRLCPAMTSNPYLKNLTIHQLFLDTTYCSPQYSFPTQQEVIDFAVKKAKEAIRRHPDTIVISGTYTIGKEKVFVALAEALGSKICVSRDKKGILGCLQWPSLQSQLTTDPLTASVHVQPMNRLNVVDLSSYLDSLHPTFSHVLAFSPTGWSHSSTRASLSTIQPKTRGTVSVYAIPYSEHSSFAELKHCVQQLKPRRIIPTVGNQSVQKRKEMERYFELWRTAMPSTCQTKQTSIDSAFVCASRS